MRLHQLKEGFSILPRIDREKYQERDGLEGPIMTRSGKVVYYDPKEGSYYDPDTDMYISYDDWKKLDSENMHKIDMEEGADKPYICVHAKKGKHECHASSSYEAAKKAAAHWKMKSTAGIDAHLAVDEGFTDVIKSVGNTFKRGFKSLTNRNNRPASPPQPNQHTARVKPGRNTNYNGTSLAQKINWGGKFESADSSAMDKALRSIEKTFGGERSAINDQVTAMCRAADMLGSDRFKDRAFSVVEQYGIDSKQELIQELHMMIKNEAEIDDEEIYGVDTNIKMMKNAITKLRKADESLGEVTESLEESQALTEAEFDEAAGEKDACYHKVKARYKVWPSAYASGALVKCRKVGAKNWGNSKKK